MMETWHKELGLHLTIEDPLKLLNTIVLWWSKGFQGDPQLDPMIPRHDSYTYDRGRVFETDFEPSPNSK